MKPKTLILVAIAVGCGLMAMLGVQQVISHQGAEPAVPTVKVIVVRDNLDTGVRLTADNTRVISMPLTAVPEDAIVKAEDFAERAAKFPFMAGDVLRKSKLTEPGQFGKSINIPIGMRVIGIPVTETQTISGLLQPKDRVDVLVTYKARGDKNTTISKTKTLLEYIEVHNCDDVTASGKNDKVEKNSVGKTKNIGLLLTPEQINYVILAQSKGQLTLSWRRRGDDELALTKPIDDKLLEELQGTVGMYDEGVHLHEQQVVDNGHDSSVADFLDSEPVSAPAVVTERPMWTVDVYRGNNLQSEKFPIDVQTP